MRQRRYLCSRCHAEVILKSGPKNIRHFAHAKGEADPSCEDYFPANFDFRGRRGTWDSIESAEGTADSMDLYIEVGVMGPRLLLWVPSVGQNVSWTGIIRITTQRVTRSLTARHLQHGQFVPFDLVDGTWTVTVVGDVPDDYRSRLNVGPASLETELNLFDATHTPGRRLGPASAVRLGDAIWFVTRNPPSPKAMSTSLAQWKPVFEGAGWSVFYVELPQEVSSADISRLSRDLQRRIRPAQVRVWLERPWPIAFRDGHVPVIQETDGAIEIRTDLPVDMVLRGPDGQDQHPRAEQSTMLTATNLLRGRWDILINGDYFSTFEIVAHEKVTAASICARVNDGPSLELAYAQLAIDHLISEGTPIATVELLWGHAAVSALVRIDGAPVSAERLSVVVPRGSGLATVDNLGTLRWRTSAVETPHKTVRPYVLRRVRSRAQWLLTVALARQSANTMKIALPASLLVDPLLVRLNGRYLPTAFTPHINALARDVRSLV
jgi:hypothetical protein